MDHQLSSLRSLLANRNEQVWAVRNGMENYRCMIHSGELSSQKDLEYLSLLE